MTIAQNSNSNSVNISSQNAYDEVPYESFPFANTRPENLQAIAKLFGLDTPKITNARILELGCAAGGNLIPHAILYPKAKFVGIDLSEVQTTAGNNLIKQLGLKNIELKQMSITDINKEFGEFDYIICHGVISWVPEQVREAILRVSSENLSPSGVAYISYNTLPGWNMVRAIRDMMLFHSKSFQNINDQVVQSKLLLDFVSEALEGSTTPYAQILQNELKLLNGQSLNYLRHDHLEEINHQYYLYEFMQNASKYNLLYLGDTSLSSMYSGNLPAKAAERLKEIPDIVRAEQYMDFITNRRFRSTILCKNQVKLARNVSGETIKPLYFSIKLTPEQARTKANVTDNSNLNFYWNGNNDNKISTTAPSLKALLYVFSENYNSYLSLTELMEKTTVILSDPNLVTAKLENEILNNLIQLIFAGYLSISSLPFHIPQKLADKPKLWSIAQAQIKLKQNWVTTKLHDRFGLSDLDFYIMRYLDGEHNKDDIVQKLVADANKNELQVKFENAVVTDQAKLESLLRENVEHRLAIYRVSALMEE